MGAIIIQSFLFIANIVVAIYMYQSGSYKAAMFNSFAAGMCLLGAIDAIYKYKES